MESTTAYYFVRVNGKTAHNNPGRVRCYIEDEPPVFPRTAFNYVDYCLHNGIIRLGWPAAGDIQGLAEIPPRTRCYTLPNHVRKYLREFRDMDAGSVILMPDKSRSGILYIGEVEGDGYEFFFRPPEHPAECAHRRKVRWDRGRHGAVVEYHARDLRLKMSGFWRRAFHCLNRSQSPRLPRRIDEARARRRHG